MSDNRGRPKTNHNGEEPAPRKFERTYTDVDGTVEVWKYDLDVFPNGPIETEITYPEHIEKERVLEIKREEREMKSLPLTKRQWLNPANGKMVGYTRAKNLGLIK